MNRRIIIPILLAALAGPVAAQNDLPAMVGRIAAVQGQVTLTGPDEAVAAGLNWPVVAGNHLHTASGARSELRAGSTAVRLDGDSDLEVLDLDDGLLRLRLNYGSVSIRLRDPELLANFELVTPQARITLLEPGLLRVDAERQADTSLIRVLAGNARVNGAGATLTLALGRAAEVNSNDMRTVQAQTDGFDRWAEERERYGDSAVSSRFVSSGMTGYEELERHGSWSESAEYGPLWTPRSVGTDWAPYRDGRWIWLAPWGWTWIDNAPWGYAPSHYGRWVMVNRRWCWAPGRPVGRPVWAPALVGWVDGHGPGPSQRPGIGWYPLTPRDHYVPAYRLSAERELRLKWIHQGRPLAPLPEQHDQPRRYDGLSVLPREQFERHGKTPGLPLRQPATSNSVSEPPRAPVENAAHWPERGRDGPDYRPRTPLNGTSPAVPLMPAIQRPANPVLNTARPDAASERKGQAEREEQARPRMDLNEHNDRQDNFQRNQKVYHGDGEQRQWRAPDEGRRALRAQEERQHSTPTPAPVMPPPAVVQQPVRSTPLPAVTAFPPPASPKDSNQHPREERRREEGRDRSEKRNQVQP